MTRLLEINLRRWLHDSKLPEITLYEQLTLAFWISKFLLKSNKRR